MEVGATAAELDLSGVDWLRTKATRAKHNLINNTHIIVDKDLAQESMTPHNLTPIMIFIDEEDFLDKVLISHKLYNDQYQSRIISSTNKDDVKIK